MRRPRRRKVPEWLSSIWIRPAQRSAAVFRHGFAIRVRRPDVHVGVRRQQLRFAPIRDRRASELVGRLSDRSVGDADAGGKSDSVDTVDQQREITGIRIPECFDSLTLGDELDAAKLSWGYYTSGLVGDGNIWDAYSSIRHIRYGPDWKTDVIRPQKQFLDDVAKGTFANGKLDYADLRQLGSRRLRIGNGSRLGNVVGRCGPDKANIGIRPPSSSSGTNMAAGTITWRHPNSITTA